MITDTHHCPKCGQLSLEFSDDKVFTCDNCGFTFYFNAATAVGGVIRRENKLLLAVRAFDPGKGLLDFPGGFVDRGEDLETALKREIHEELGLEVTTTKYLTSCANDYRYKNVPYVTCDAYFVCTVEDFSTLTASDDISDYRWVDLNKVEDREFAFESSRQAVRCLRQR